MTDGREQHPADQLAAYILGVLEPGETAEIEAHLSDCESCRVEADWLLPALDVLPSSVQPLEPPRRMRRNVLAAVRKDARLEAAEAGNPAPRLGFSWPAPLAGAVATLALATAGIGGYLAADGGEPQPSSQTLEAAAPEARAAGGTVSVLGETGTVEVRGLPQLRDGDVYQAWIRRGDEIVPSSVFVVDRGGDGTAALIGLEDADEIMITREPPGGSERPSTAPLLRALLS